MLVTGATSGIGKGTALLLARLGARVIVNGIDPAGGQEVVSAIDRSGGDAGFELADVSAEGAVATMFEHVRDQWGGLDVLVNNAGIDLHKPLMETSFEEWERIYAVDVKGIYHCVRHAVPLMVGRNAPAIINIASVHATATVGTIAAYAGAKGAVVALSRSLALELAPRGIRVNVVSPGGIETEIMNQWVNEAPDPAARRAAFSALHPIGFMGKPEDIGWAIAYLASPRARFTTGSELLVDGGMTASLYDERGL